MKKLTVLVVVILIAGLLAGCWLFSDEPELISIVVEPEGIYLADPGTAYDLLSTTGTIESVTACYDDWTTKEIVLTDCEYISLNTDVATVFEGLITAVDSGETIIIVGYETETDIVGVFVNQ